MSTRHVGLTAPLRVPVVRWLVVLCWVEALAVSVYLLATPVRVESLRYVLYPFVWINVGFAAVLWTNPPETSRRLELVAGTVAIAYFFVLAGLAGLVSVDFSALLGGGHAHAGSGHTMGWQFTLTAPGWGPRFGYTGDVVSAAFVPYRVVGYLALSYLVYAAVLDTARTVLSGALGLVSCIGCTFPVVAGLTAGLAGGTGVVSALQTLSIDLSTVVFVAAVVVLAFRPSTDGETGK
ncbi:hypothetical protein GJR96_12200 [Haloferax sp. MBLA0076]|uniref:Uncharacterized protein n=1 Tax=Haloferax litoreum TaxID=2666140 RepID=A0A6A8GHN2_9EURY|nr:MULTISPECIES: hypothetical protein [Haloferax]KAB1194150.1 hypothetical protein Hfx1148_12140 [Haloferax sp. CBA1148]MRX22708.1 hypothetical protein [Haloferax litoreum]